MFPSHHSLPSFYCWAWHRNLWDILLISLSQLSWLCPFPISCAPKLLAGRAVWETESPWCASRTELLFNSWNIAILSRVFIQIQSILPCKPLWRKVILPHLNERGTGFEPRLLIFQMKFLTILCSFLNRSQYPLFALYIQSNIHWVRGRNISLVGSSHFVTISMIVLFKLLFSETAILEKAFFYSSTWWWSPLMKTFWGQSVGWILIHW